MMRMMNAGHHRAHLHALRKLKVSPRAQVLDIGCGGGGQLPLIMDLIPEGRLCAVDISEDAVSFCQKRYAKISSNRLEILKADVLKLPFDDESFAAATAFETVYFWEDLDAAFKEVLRVLKKKGALLIMLEAVEKNSPWIKTIEGMRVYTVAELDASLKRAGFGQIDIYKEGQTLTLRACKRGG